jgi:GAF domain-containing protein
MRKDEAYKWAQKQINAQIKRHENIISTLANITAILKERFPNYFWVGFYLLKENHLLLGPFQGPPACMKLELANGVCATAVKTKQTIIVENVHQFPGHVACDKRSNSEIVVPVYNNKGDITAVLDVDSEKINDFDQTDQKGLEIIAASLKGIMN